MRNLSPLTFLLAPAQDRPDLDGRIVATAQKSYNFRVHLKGDAIQVASRDGHATLSGTVADEYHKALAEDTVKGIDGVQSVDNRLLIQSDAPAAPPDARLVTRVLAALRYHRNVDAAATHVAARDGVVTLDGTASSAAHKALAEDIAENVDGVRSVKNNLKVATSPARPRTLAEKIDDASVTAQVKAVLLAHRGTHMLTTRVKTHRGVVTLQGEARNPAEKELVLRLVSDVNGVKRIVNRMTVAQ